MHAIPRAEREIWRGLACTRLTLANGDNAVVSDLGAQVLSWVANGQERLFLSPHAVLDGSAPIRGGIPVCFPQFNQRGGLPKHGLARRAMWQWTPQEPSGAAAGAPQAQAITSTWQWQHSAGTQALWPYAFHAQLHVSLQPGALQVALAVQNTGDRAWPFTAALHTYLRIQNAASCALHGLADRAYWDAAQGFAPAVQQGAVVLGEEVDRVYPGTPQPLTLVESDGTGAGAVQIAQDAAWPETVVWNPGPTLCATLHDMASESWRHMLCVEAALINQPQALLPGAHWQAAQRFQVV